MASEYYRQLQDATLITDLRIPEIIDDFHGNDDTTEDMIAWVSAAFSMLGSGLGPVPALVSFVQKPPSQILGSCSHLW